MSATEQAVRELAHLIEEISGNVIPDGHFPFLKEIAAHRAREQRLRDVPTYVTALARGALTDEWSRLLPLITVNESYFFRSPQHFRALHSTVLPALVQARGSQRMLRVWSAGCARGEEPATVAILLEEMRHLAGWDWRITATDVDEVALADARTGLYNSRAVEQVPSELLARHFTAQGELFLIARHLLAHIDYRMLNLIREPYQPPTHPYDLILLRNVLIYFRPSSQRRVIANMARSLAPDGYLFLGPSETLWQLSDEFMPEDLGDCFCYRLRGELGAPGPSPSAALPRPPSAARERVVPAASLARRHRPAVPSPSTPPAADERQAPAAVTLPPSSTPDRIGAIAGALAANRLTEADDALRQALLADPADPGLRCLEGLVHDLSGRSGEAAASYRAALFLDPSLFQIRLLLADTLRRTGWGERARHEYREVLAALASGRAREVGLGELALPDRATAEARCRQALEKH